MGAKLAIHDFENDKRLCSSCGLWKFTCDFTRHKHGKDGIGCRCKECDKLKARENRKRNSIRINKLRRLSYDPIRNYESVKRWRSKNKEKVNEGERMRYLRNPRKALEKDYRRRSLKINKGTITNKEWKALCEFYGNRCLCCGRTNVKLTQDHVVPLKLGGSNTIDNAQPLCKSCNSSKGAKYVDYRIGVS